MKESFDRNTHIQSQREGHDTDQPGRYRLRLLATTDLHAALTGYDYYRENDTAEMGLSRTASLIHQAREEVPNHLLLDNGDIIQGNPIGDYAASSRFWYQPKAADQGSAAHIAGVKEEKAGSADPKGVHPMIKLMNMLQYDAATVGNHEFNYGLDYLADCLDGADFPYTNANVYLTEEGQVPRHLMQPYLIIPREMTGESGESALLNIGIIGLVPPQILNWDKGHLEGRVIVRDMVETVEEMVPQLQLAGADIIVLLAHTGYMEEEDPSISENAALRLSRINGVDTLIFGHAHKLYPSDEFAGRPGVNLDKGTINGIPAVEPGVWGSHLGIIDLELERTAEKWNVLDSHARLRAVSDRSKLQPAAAADPRLEEAARSAHEYTLSYIRTPIGKTSLPLYSYFALIMDTPVVQIINDAQIWYTRQQLADTEYAHLPLLSAASAFKTGGRYGPGHYTDIPPGELTLRHMSDIYSYANTLCAVRLNGEELREWLEWSAALFQTIDPVQPGEQELIDPAFSPFNFDVIDGVSYTIDISCPARYNAAGQRTETDQHRIQNLRHYNLPVTGEMEFIIVTNQYRAYTTKLANPDGQRIVLNAQIENRDVVTEYVRQQGTVSPQADHNWSIMLGVPNQQADETNSKQTPIGTAVSHSKSQSKPNPNHPHRSVIAAFSSSPAAAKYIAEHPQLSILDSTPDGFLRYGMRLDINS
ncbi:bifunctional 2',3'-cyclic-nucleotide 2'-phosphodiesterase/3'-nucleotidase [Paenibacillus sp. Z6-24]